MLTFHLTKSKITNNGGFLDWNHIDKALSKAVNDLGSDLFWVATWKTLSKGRLKTESGIKARGNRS